MNEHDRKSWTLKNSPTNPPVIDYGTDPGAGRTALLSKWTLVIGAISMLLPIVGPKLKLVDWIPLKLELWAAVILLAPTFITILLSSTGIFVEVFVFKNKEFSLTNQRFVMALAFAIAGFLIFSIVANLNWPHS